MTVMTPLQVLFMTTKGHVGVLLTFPDKTSAGRSRWLCVFWDWDAVCSVRSTTSGMRFTRSPRSLVGGRRAQSVGSSHGWCAAWVTSRLLFGEWSDM
jgi:hypothetical protein